MAERDRELERILQRKLRKLLSSTQKTKSSLAAKGKVIKLTSKNFDRVISDPSLPVLVDFWAECVCHAM